ncbi:hypothetical protein ABVF61_00575 [Roseibium sp. HPY-6]|uniref:hypothetical protein n=1 Tax=Roseibium sp. HPY-6 TaxID=3229852 RepID=UPI00338D39F0
MKVSRLVEKDPSSVLRWSMPKSKGGAEGRVPAGNFFKIWSEIITSGSSLSLEELVFTEDERQQIADLRNQYSSNPTNQSSRKTNENCGVDS